MPALHLLALRVCGVYASVKAAQQQEATLNAMAWATNPLACIYAVSEGEDDETEQNVPNLLYEPATGTLHMGIGTQGTSLRVPVEALRTEEAQRLYVNLHRWYPGTLLQKLSLADVPPLGPAYP